jgi:hypothetical protein
LHSDLNGAVVACSSSAPDFDLVVPRADVVTGIEPQGDVVAAIGRVERSSVSEPQAVLSFESLVTQNCP